MHPALSVVFFTTASGAGYGMLVLLGLLGAAGLLPPVPGLGAAGLGLALILITAGLGASTLHLGHPERAWRAFSQWRSSWLSREGVAAVATYAPALLFAAGWVLWGRTGGAWAVAGLLAAAGAALTVYCTAMIYASLKPVPRWRNRWVVPGYFAIALATGAPPVAAVTAAFGAAGPALPLLAALACVAAGLLKWLYWREIDAERPIATAETATGLGRFGRVRLLEAPHTEDNYLLQEMAFRIGRKHAERLRRIALGVGFGVPALLAAIAAFLPPAAQVVLLVLASVAALAGAFVERWLFFAEAKHAVTLYYGASEI